MSGDLFSGVMGVFIYILKFSMDVFIVDYRRRVLNDKLRKIGVDLTFIGFSIYTAVLLKNGINENPLDDILKISPKTFSEALLIFMFFVCVVSIALYKITRKCSSPRRHQAPRRTRIYQMFLLCFSQMVGFASLGIGLRFL